MFAIFPSVTSKFHNLEWGGGMVSSKNREMIGLNFLCVAEPQENILAFFEKRPN